MKKNAAKKQTSNNKTDRRTTESGREGADGRKKRDEGTKRGNTTR